MTSRLISSAAASTIFTLEWAKQFLRVTHSHEDELIQDLLAAAVSKCERYGRFSITEKTHELIVAVPRISSFSCLLRPDVDDADGIHRAADLTMRRVSGVTSVVAMAADESLVDVTLPTTAYRLVNQKVVWAPGMWGDIRSYDYLAIRYTTGFPNKAALLEIAPDVIEAVGLALVAGYDREVDISQLPGTAAKIMETYWTPV